MKNVKNSRLSGSNSVNSTGEYMVASLDDSELEASSVQSIEINMEIVKGKEISMQSVDSKSFNDSSFSDGKKYVNNKIRRMYWVALAALTNAFCMGFGGTYTATATSDMNRRESIIRPNLDQVGWIGSLLPLGALFGGLIAGHITQSLGRKETLLLCNIPFTAGWLLVAYATSLPYVYIGRFIIGSCCGIVSVTTPMYLVEISTPEVRGSLGASFQLFVTIGILVVACLGSSLHWMWSAFIGACFSVLTIIVITLVPESPRWLLAKGKRKKAVYALKYLQGDFLDAEQECQLIQDDIAKQPTGNFQFLELTAPEAYKPAIISLSLMFFQQCSGVNAILFYSGDIFKNAGSTISSNLCTIIVALMQLISTAISNILIDKTGRKLLLLVSGVFMGISLSIFAIFDLVAIKNGDLEKDIRIKYGWLSLLSLIMFITAFSLGFGPIPWLMVSEMTTPRLRSATSGAATALNWMFAFAVTNSYNNLVSGMGIYGTYLFYSSICFTSCLFTFYFVPETKGKDMEDIREYFLPRKHGSIRMVEEAVQKHKNEIKI